MNCPALGRAFMLRTKINHVVKMNVMNVPFVYMQDMCCVNVMCVSIRKSPDPVGKCQLQIKINPELQARISRNLYLLANFNHHIYLVYNPPLTWDMYISGSNPCLL